MTKTLKTVLLSLLTLIVAASSPVSARQGEVFSRITDKQLETILGKLEITFEVVDKKVYKTKLDGIQVLIFNKDEDFQLFASFSKGDRQVAYTRINEWNKGHRFSTAYLDKDGDPAIKADMDFEGGVTEEAITRFIGIFKQSASAFQKFLTE